MRKGADTVKSILSNAPEPGDAGLVRYAEVYLPRFEVLNEKRGVTRYEAVSPMFSSKISSNCRSILGWMLVSISSTPRH